MEEAKIQPAAVTSRKLPKEFKYYFIFMGPAILLFSSLFVIPFFGEIYYSFTNWNGIDQTYGMVGINNYFRTFQDKGYWKSVWFTIRFSALSVLFSNLIAFCWPIFCRSPSHSEISGGLSFSSRVSSEVWYWDIYGDSSFRMHLCSSDRPPGFPGFPKTGLRLRSPPLPLWSSYLPGRSPAI